MTFNRLAVTLLFLAIATTACLMPAQSDTFWQLLRRARHRDHWPDPPRRYLHVPCGAYWPNHEWLSEVLFYGHAVGGMPLLTAFAASMIVKLWALRQVMRGPALFRVVLILFVLVTSAALDDPATGHQPGIAAILLVLVKRQRGRLCRC